MTPLLVLADALDLIDAPSAVLDATAGRLVLISERCGPNSATFENPAKDLALQLAGTMPCVWGTSALAGVAAYRTACQLAENAKYPCQWGVLPEAGHNQIVAFDGPYAGFGGRGAGDDFFRDRIEDESGPPRLRVVLLRGIDEQEPVARRADVVEALAGDRGVRTTTVTAEGETTLQRFAWLVALVDYASVYLALMAGLDPSAVVAIDELKQRAAQ